MDKIEQILWADPQQAQEAGRCPICRGVVYRPSLTCARCGRDEP